MTDSMSIVAAPMPTTSNAEDGALLVVNRVQAGVDNLRCQKWGRRKG